MLIFDAGKKWFVFINMAEMFHNMHNYYNIIIMLKLEIVPKCE
jgi:hypothetical protein